MFASHTKVSESVAWPVKEPDDGKNSEHRAKQWRVRNRTSVSQVRSTVLYTLSLSSVTGGPVMAHIYSIASKTAVPQTWQKSHAHTLRHRGMAALNEAILLLCWDLAQGCGPISTGTGDNVKYTLICLPSCREGGHLDPSKMQAPSHVTGMILQLQNSIIFRGLLQKGRNRMESGVAQFLQIKHAKPHSGKECGVSQPLGYIL